VGNDGYIRSGYGNNLCLEAHEGTVGARLCREDCNGCEEEEDQQWQLTSEGHLVLGASNQCLGVEAPGAAATLGACGDSDDQKWELVEPGSDVRKRPPVLEDSDSRVPGLLGLPFPPLPAPPVPIAPPVASVVVPAVAPALAVVAAAVAPVVASPSHDRAVDLGKPQASSGAQLPTLPTSWQPVAPTAAGRFITDGRNLWWEKMGIKHQVTKMEDCHACGCRGNIILVDPRALDAVPAGPAFTCEAELPLRQ